MQSYARQIKGLSQLFIYVLALAGIMWILTPYPLFWQGVLLGMAIGMGTIFSTALRVNRIGQAVVESRRIPRLGLTWRLGMAVIGGIVLIRFPDSFDIVGVAVGLVVPIAITIINGIVFQLREGEERGE